MRGDVKRVTVSGVEKQALLVSVAETTAATDASQADPGSDASKAVAVQGVTNGKPVPVSDNGGSLTVDGAVTISGTLPAFAATPTVNAAQSGNWLAGVKGADGSTIVTSSIGTKLNDGSQSSVGGTHLTMGGVDTGTNVYRPALVDSSGRFQVIPSGNVASGASDSGNPLKIAGVYNSTLPTFTNGQRGDIQIEPRGGIYAVLKDNNGTGVTRVLSPSAAFSPQVGLIVNSQGFCFNGSTYDQVRKANATSRIISSAATTNATSAKASAGDVFMITGRNTNAAVIYLKLYNKASAPTVGSDTPTHTFALPPQASFTFDWPQGRYFSTGIAYALTTGSADADTGAVASGDILGLNIDYA